MAEIWVRAPLAVRNFRPGQFYRLQTFESTSPVVAGTRLQIPQLTVSGAGTKGDMIRLLVLQFGAGPRLVSRLRRDQPVVLMGPTGKPTEIPRNETVMVVAGRWGAAVMLDIGAALRAAGNRVLYVAAFARADDVDHQDELEAGADQIIWCDRLGADDRAPTATWTRASWPPTWSRWCGATATASSGPGAASASRTSTVCW
ncbi:MAG: hypothetical protein U5K43_01810 [Halofilum sp. (in: g-proteobacteria)]|nr:hypothetical protein [Halofilum sp. (in: g-proteobacteria)]